MQVSQEGDKIIAKLDDEKNLIVSLEAVVKKYKIQSGLILSGIGMFKKVKLGYFDGKRYITKEFDKPMELISLQGNIAFTDKPIFHMHCCISGQDKNAYAGHLLDATIRVTNEIAILKLKKIKLTRKLNKFGLMGLEIK
ncbi:MAG: PPC domain-containing DNA-binding protein [Thermoplasmata archaeon]